MESNILIKRPNNIFNGTQLNCLSSQIILSLKYLACSEFTYELTLEDVLPLAYAPLFAGRHCQRASQGNCGFCGKRGISISISGFP